MKNFFRLAALLAFVLSLSLQAQASPIAAGVSFAQVDFTFSDATQLNSQYGQVFLDYSQMAGSGYVNVKTQAGWVVQNMPVFGGTGLPGLSMMFDLGFSGVQTSPFQATVDFSATPLVNDSSLTGPAQSFGILRHVEFNATDGAGDLGGVPASPAGKMSVTFDPNGKTTPAVINTFMRSVEQDDFQCGPGAVANSLAYLKARYGIKLQHQNIPGINGVPEESLAGQIDKLVPRAKGQGVWRSDLLNAKLKYLNEFGPKNLVIQHQGVFDNKDGVVISDNVTQGAVTSTFKGGLVTLDYLMKEIHDGEDVEMDLTYNGKFGAGHEIMITGGDFILGRPWVTFIQDQWQGGGDNATKGTGLFDGGYGFAWLDDPGGGKFLQFKGYLVGANGLNAEVRNVITESVPEPMTLLLTGLGAGMATLFGARSRRAGDRASS